jgi:Effector Associated Constant Component 1
VSVFEVVIEPHNDSYAPDDDRWGAQVAALGGELDAVVDTTQRVRQAPGTKGAFTEVVVALGSAGAFTATVECLRAWLGRDRSRRVELRWNDGSTERSISLTGEAIDSETVREITKAAVNRVGGAAWQADTAPS